MNNSTQKIDSKDRLSIINVDGLYKKFSKDLKANMLYGIQDLSKAFFGMKTNSEVLRKSEFWALEGLSLDIYDNEITALLGTNGSGKTTLIRVMSGIYEMDKGSVVYNGAIKKVVSIFAIKSGLHPTLTGRENIYLKGAFYGLSKDEIGGLMDFIIEFSGVQEFIDAPLGNYSSGMKTRLAMSIALSIDADIMFIDEGFSFSDPGFKQRCFDLLINKYKRKGKALIYTTHQIGKINELCDRVILLNEGKIVSSTRDVNKGVVEYLKYCK